MAGGRGAAEVGAGASRTEPGKPRPERRRQLVRTEEAVFKPRAQTTHKQSQVGGLHAGLSVQQVPALGQPGPPRTVSMSDQVEQLWYCFVLTVPHRSAALRVTHVSICVAFFTLNGDTA